MVPLGPGDEAGGIVRVRADKTPGNQRDIQTLLRLDSRVLNRFSLPTLLQGGKLVGDYTIPTAGRGVLRSRPSGSDSVPGG